MAGREVFGEEEIKAVTDVLKRKVLFRYGFDQQRQNIFKVAEFERAFADYIGVAHALGVSSGTASLKVALEALDLPRGGEVITTCFTFVATVESIEEAGLKPVLCDMDESMNISPSGVEKKITSKTVAVAPVHMMGAACDMAPLMAIAKKRNVKVIEDACQATGASYRGKKLGAIGDMGCFSFDYVKVMTTGEGGMVVTNDEKLHERADWLHDHGHPHLAGVPRGKEQRMGRGFNFRMDEIHGALGLAQLHKLDSVIARQKENKKAIKEAIQNLPGVTFRTLHDPAGDIATFLTFFLPTPSAAGKVREKMAAQGVAPATLGYWHFAALVGDDASSFAGSQEILDRSVTLEIQTLMAPEQIQKIIAAVRSAVT